MWKICIFTLVIAVAAATTSETITNDLTAKGNQTQLKISTEASGEIAAVGGSTSTATPTTTATTSTTTTRATTVAEPNGEAPEIGLMTSPAQKEVPASDLGELGGIKNALHRIKLSEQPVEITTTTTEQPEQPEAVDQDEEQEEEEVTPTISPLQIQMQAAASYQVAETLADLNDEERARYDAMLAQQPTASKLNIVDLYPLKIEDLQPIIQSDNDELIKQRTIFTQPENAEEYKQNLMPNEVEFMVNKEVDEVREKIKINREKLSTSTTVKPTTSRPQQGTTADFTGKLLADQDDLITEIESKFQLHETTTLKPRVTTIKHPGNTFIDRRVKKSFEFPMQHRASDVMAMPHIDFANTKFQTDGDAPNPPASHPEFSTTKFYNSKELYNEMLLHNKRKLMKAAKADGSPIKSAEDTTRHPANLNVTPGGKTFNPATTTRTTATTTTSGTTTSTRTTTTESTTAAPAAATTTIGTTTTTTRTTTSGRPTTSTGKYQKELKRAKLLLKAVLPPPKSTSDKPTEAAAAAGVGVVAAASLSTTTMATPMATPARSRMPAANPTKTASKPIARPRILSRLQEKINSLECEIPNVPQDSHLWRGNETHELLLPIVTMEHCKQDERCIPNVLTWRGEAEIQSGDILIVEINDAMLNPSHEPNNTSSAVHATQVYQVTRSGHEHCDVTEGVLLDITPLVVDGRKLVTLYDKDLTEGVNLLIVVSELWGAQCVRLKVTTKTDNCGDNADCSGKGVCYSNSGMEEFECQCCSGFAGPHCEEIDACNPSPCTNNGICVDLSQGHEGNSYQCLCPYGYAGKNCQYESDPCNPAECMNGGSCVGNSTHFRCDCAPGFTGPLCQHSLNECESSPCVHGICVDQEDGFRCFCQPGFAGELCNFEYNECESNPCQNGGECIDHIGSYECRCTKGYSGNRCQIKVDFCANKPCPEGHRCIDHGNDFSCECPGGRNGPDCNQMPRTYFQQCNVNPCTHGGTCWSSGDSFYCACRPGYTGTMCEDEFVVETVVSSSEFIVDDANARNFNDKTFGSSVVLKSPIELHNAYFAAGVLAAAIFIVAVVVTICHCKVNQTYRKFSTRSTSFIPILGFSRRPKMQGKLNKHWLSGKGAAAAGGGNNVAPAGGPRGGAGSSGGGVGGGAQQGTRHLPGQPQTQTTQTTLGGQLQERPFQRHLAMNLENDMYYTVDFSENSQHSPLIQ
ncbi:LOW QUALITY PROTEIN: protein HEG [Drosophila ficusphila]|uniref:LOW QUALITY PROTEIN: protein HEG n=1 Tax=Drosophila ficusphila TaxID=30025 RepID=UPI001C8A76D4|nr:LOW QUALITY PROTEIN: protein HEG [Drosophila ficusphila]